MLTGYQIVQVIGFNINKKGGEMDLFELFESDTTKVIPLIEKYLGKGVSDYDNYLYYPSKSPLLLQAHIDTLANYKRKYELHVRHNIITCNGVLGADDRAGVFAIYDIYTKCKGDKKKDTSKLDMPSLLFTNYEETGGKGMDVFLKTKSPKDFEHINLAISIDRRGCNDYVNYVSIDKKVDDYIEDFGFIHSHGSYSDIKEFSEFTEIPSVNVSAGYYFQHTNMERLHYDELSMTINKIVRIIKNPIDKKYKCRKKYAAASYRYDDGWGNSGYSYNRGYLTDEYWANYKKSFGETQYYKNNCPAYKEREEKLEKRRLIKLWRKGDRKDFTKEQLQKLFPNMSFEEEDFDKSIELEPCPWCGAQSELVILNVNGYSYRVCEDCKGQLTEIPLDA
jgi:hypothetical protein